MNYKFKRTESFRIRDGWIENALNTIDEVGGKEVFTKNNGIAYLGIGSNMVKSVKYWLSALGLITTGINPELTRTARLLLQYDKYLEEPFSWFYLHYRLVTNEAEAPVFYFAFNLDSNMALDRESLSEKVFEYYNELMDGRLNRASVDSDVSVFFQSYYATEKELNETPENSTVCPFASLKLFKMVSGRRSELLERCEPVPYSRLDSLLVYYSLVKAFGDEPFTIDEAVEKECGPCRVFNLSRVGLGQHLDRLRKQGLLEINRTAGLNMIYRKERIADEAWLFRKHFEDMV